MDRSDLTDDQNAPAENLFGHDYSQHFLSPEGYAVCCACGARRTTDKAARKCARLVFPTIEDWGVARRMIEDRARAELMQELELAAAPDDRSDEIVEGAEYWIIDPRLVITPVLACVQDLMKPGVVFFTTGNVRDGYREFTRPRSAFNLRRQLAAVIRSRDEATEKDPG